MARRGGISRRDFFKLSLMSLGSVALAACHLSARPPTPTLIPTAIPSPIPPLATLTPAPTERPTATPLACVRLLTPENGAKLPATGRVTFSWEPMPNAAAYWLEFTLPSGQTVTFDSGGSRDLYMEAFRQAGIYYWQVSALGRGGGLLCTSEPFTFERGK